MKHALLLMLMAALAYGLWVLSHSPRLRPGLGRMGGHALRLFALCLGVLALVLLSFHLPSLKLL